MSFRTLILNNFGWKITALALAITVRYALRPQDGPLLPSAMHTRYLVSHPITLSKPATDLREFKVSPETVDITLSGDAKILKDLDDREVRATVDIRDLAPGTNTVRIHVYVPPEGGIKLERLAPEQVHVELLNQ
jgi:YbbR domain-containing protein